MIVKLVIHKNQDAISIWNRVGDRLYYSDKAPDIEEAKNLLTYIVAKTDKEHAMEHMGEGYTPTYGVKPCGYFNAKFVKGIVHLVKRADGYNW